MPTSHHSVFLQAGCFSCCPTKSVKALKEGKLTGRKYSLAYQRDDPCPYIVVWQFDGVRE